MVFDLLVECWSIHGGSWPRVQPRGPQAIVAQLGKQKRTDGGGCNPESQTPGEAYESDRDHLPARPSENDEEDDECDDGPEPLHA